VEIWGHHTNLRSKAAYSNNPKNLEPGAKNQNSLYFCLMLLCTFASLRLGGKQSRLKSVSICVHLWQKFLRLKKLAVGNWNLKISFSASSNNQ
jgi:hypothetical protein